MFSKSCKYGLKAIIYIASHSLEGKKVVKIKEIAEVNKLPMAFTAKLMGILTRFNLVESQTGPNGGFFMDPNKMKDIKLSQIVNALDGDFVYKGCGLGLDYCDSENPCPLHQDFEKIRNDLKSMLETTTIDDLARKVKAGESVLVRL
ncbi:MAG TPA: Rrf2 family transcriptional regulator [Moheibacter sp.]|nr:Rrf2 family transcriptional regulator [Moheibacter sp.]